MTGSITIKPAYGTYSGTHITLMFADMSDSKAAGLMEMPFPLSDSNETDVFDFMGCTRKFSVNGTFPGNTGSIQAFVGSIFSLITGQQTYSSLFSPQISGSIIVKTSDVSYDYVRGNPNAIEFNMKFIQSSTSS